MAAVSDQFWTDLKINLTPDTVDVRTTSTVNNYGERTFSGGATTYDAYVRRKNTTDRDSDERGDALDYEYVVYIMDDSLTLNVQDQVSLPAPVSGTRPVVMVETRKDPGGQVGVVAYVGGR